MSENSDYADAAIDEARSQLRECLDNAKKLVEVTPQSIRLRKRYLDPHERKKASRRVEG